MVRPPFEPHLERQAELLGKAAYLRPEYFCRSILNRKPHLRIEFLALIGLFVLPDESQVGR